MSASGALREISARNQIVLEMAKEGSHKGFSSFLRRMERDTIARLHDEESIVTRARLTAVIVDIKEIQQEIFTEYLDGFGDELVELSMQQAEIEAISYETIIADFKSSVPAQQKIITAYKVNPMTVSDFTGEPLLENFMKQFSKTSIRRIRNEVTSGYFRGATMNEIVSSLRGTLATNRRDGAFFKINTQNRMFVRTAYQHVASQARQEVMKANQDITDRYRWVSTLDDSTSPICRGLDGLVFKHGEGPVPPAHIGCRSETVAILKGDLDFDDEFGERVSKGEKKGKKYSESTTYYDFLKDQSQGFQDKVLGETRAKLLRDGGLTSKEFAAMSLNKNFKPISLKGMRHMRPDVFKKAGL